MKMEGDDADSTEEKAVEMLAIVAIVPAALSAWLFAQWRARNAACNGEEFFDALRDWPTQCYAKAMALLLLLLMLLVSGQGSG